MIGSGWWEPGEREVVFSYWVFLGGFNIASGVEREEEPGTVAILWYLMCLHHPTVPPFVFFKSGLRGVVIHLATSC